MSVYLDPGTDCLCGSCPGRWPAREGEYGGAICKCPCHTGTPKKHRLRDAAELKRACLTPRVVVDTVKQGELMRQMRQDSGKSLREVAARLKLSAPYLSDVERGNRNIGFEHLQAFINFCSK